MKSKTEKNNKTTQKADSGSEKKPAKKSSPKPKSQLEDDDVDGMEDEELKQEPLSKKGQKGTVNPKKKNKDDEEEDDDEIVDDWNKVEEEAEWDADFEEFDMPKSKGKKGKNDEDDFKLDDEFKDMELFNDNEYDDEEDDY